MLNHIHSFNSFFIVSILKLCFCKQHHHISGQETCVVVVKTQAKSDRRVGHLNIILARGGGQLNNIIFKSSNVRIRPGGGGVEVSS